MRSLPLVLALALAPALVAADHVYSHRFVFEGRLVGSDGTPLPGRHVTFTSVGDPLVEPCASSPSTPATDDWGDFRFCFHIHELKTSTRAGVRVGNVSVLKPMDTGFRRTIVELTEPNETGVAPAGWENTFRIGGKAWQPGTNRLENVQVFGLAVTDLPVNLTITSAAGERKLQNITDGFGDFDFTVELRPGEEVGNVTLRLEALGRSQPAFLDPFSHRTTTPLYLQADVAGDVVASFPQSTPRVSAPGGTPPISSGLVTMVALGLIGAVWLAQRKK